MFRKRDREILFARVPISGVDYLPLGNGVKEYILLKDFVIRWRRGNVDFKIVVPKRFNTDFGTTPFKIFNEDYMLAGYIIHDWIYYERTNDVEKPWYFYRNPRSGEWEPAIADWNQSDADSLMQDIQTYHKAPWWKHSVVYRAVRLFGKRYWES